MCKLHVGVLDVQLANSGASTHSEHQRSHTLICLMLEMADGHTRPREQPALYGWLDKRVYPTFAGVNSFFEVFWRSPAGRGAGFPGWNYPLDKPFLISNLRNGLGVWQANLAARVSRRPPLSCLWEPFELPGIAWKIPRAPVGIAQEPAAVFVDADGWLPGYLSPFGCGEQGIEAKKPSREQAEE